MPCSPRAATSSSRPRPGYEALDLLVDLDIDLVLLDLMMPGLNGHEVCRRIRSDDRTAFLPVVMITASGPEERLTALEAGADDFVTKPFDSSELLARVASLARLKRYHDTIETQAAELARWNAELERRVAAGVDELERTNRLRHFLGSQLAEVVVADDALLDSHRREITVVFFDFHGFTSFAETSEPEEVMARAARLPRRRRRARRRAGRHPGALHRRRRDGVLQRPGPLRRPGRPGGPALPGGRPRGTPARGGLAAAGTRADPPRRDLAWATPRWDGSASPAASTTPPSAASPTCASRLCGDAGDWEVRVSDRVLAALGDRAEAELVGDVQPRGFSRSVRVHTIRSLDGQEATT